MPPARVLPGFAVAPLAAAPLKPLMQGTSADLPRFTLAACAMTLPPGVPGHLALERRVRPGLRLTAALAFLLWLLPAAACAAEPTALLPQAVRFAPAQGLSGVETAVLRGAPDAAGIYVLRVRLAPGARIPPHHHPDERSTTVLAGSLRFGFGGAFDEAALREFPAGSFYLVPALRSHYLQAGSEGALYEEVGYGPTANLMAR